jgi:hypothetical protein
MAAYSPQQNSVIEHRKTVVDMRAQSAQGKRFAWMAVGRSSGYDPIESLANQERVRQGAV